MSLTIIQCGIGHKKARNGNDKKSYVVFRLNEDPGSLNKLKYEIQNDDLRMPITNFVPFMRIRNTFCYSFEIDDISHFTVRRRTRGNDPIGTITITIVDDTNAPKSPAQSIPIAIIP